MQEKARKGFLGASNILWVVGGGAIEIAGGFTRKDFMNRAFSRMTTTEQVDFFVETPSNIPAQSFEVYGVALALVAETLVGKKPHLIQEGDNLFQQLQQTKVTSLGMITFDDATKSDHEIDFVVERGLCSLLVGELDERRTLLGLDSMDSPYRRPSIVKFFLENSKDDKANDLCPGLCKLFETWLIEGVFPRFRDNQEIQFKLRDYYDDPSVLKHLEGLEGVGGSPLAVAAVIVKIGIEATTALDNVKTSAKLTLGKVFPYTQNVHILAHLSRDIFRIDRVISNFGMPMGPSQLQDSDRYAAAMAVGKCWQLPSLIIHHLKLSIFQSLRTRIWKMGRQCHDWKSIQKRREGGVKFKWF